MTKELIFKNSLGAEIEFSNAAPFVILNFSENTDVSVYNNKSVNQDGVNYLGNTIEESDRTIEFSIIADTGEELIELKSNINKVFNPKLGEGWLIYRDSVKELKTRCIINKIPFFSPINNIACKGLISLTASNPFWQDIFESKKGISLWEGNLQFPLEVTNEGIEVGYRGSGLLVNVFNKGDVECGMRIEFKALGEIINPSLFDVNTQKYFKLNKTMVAGEIIEISTFYGNKKIISKLNGEVEDAFNYIDFSSTFLQLQTGNNIFRYAADEGVNNLECSIYYTQMYLGV